MLLFIGCLPPPHFFKYKTIKINKEDLKIKTHATVVGNKFLDISTSVSLINNKSEILEIKNIDYEIHYPEIIFDTTVVEKSYHEKSKPISANHTFRKLLVIPANDTLMIYFISIPTKRIDRKVFIKIWKEDILEISLIINDKKYNYKLIGTY